MKKSETTRLKILQKAYELIYAKGYQTTSLDDILAATEVTKGAFYYHFKNKDEMGTAVVDELMKPALTKGFMDFFQKEDNPLEAIYNFMSALLLEKDFIRMEYGCPVANLVNEMAPWHPGFSKLLNEVTQQWTKAMTICLVGGKTKGFVRNDVDVKQVTLFVLSGYWGIRNFGKLENDRKVYRLYLKELKNYLGSLA